ncbi:MAG: pyrroline-5-carboxylate reductase [Spirochaetales bacterium]|nr:pyrroline-5-carboxylate reductase [Spirochaetales bacterium]
MKSIGIVGFGNMGEAMVQGLRQRNPDIQVRFAEKFPAQAKKAVETYGAIDCTKNLSDLVNNVEILVLAIKPQDLVSLGVGLKPLLGQTPIISILAGKTIESVIQATGATTVARFMPSLAASVQKALVGVSFSDSAGSEFRELAFDVAQSIGTALEVQESLMSAVTGVSGSGIAFAFAYLQAMALAGTKVGIPYNSSLSVAMDVMEGAISMIRSTTTNPVEYISRVCSPAGTTIEGITELEKHGFSYSLIAAVEAATRRSTELES